jgi:hypothetical protein
MAPEPVLLFGCENAHWLFVSFGARPKTAGCLLPGCLRAERGQVAREEASYLRNLWFVKISV